MRAHRNIHEYTSFEPGTAEEPHDGHASLYQLRIEQQQRKKQAAIRMKVLGFCSFREFCRFRYVVIEEKGKTCL